MTVDANKAASLIARVVSAKGWKYGLKCPIQLDRSATPFFVVEPLCAGGARPTMFDAASLLQHFETKMVMELPTTRRTITRAEAMRLDHRLKKDGAVTVMWDRIVEYRRICAGAHVMAQLLSRVVIRFFSVGGASAVREHMEDLEYIARRVDNDVRRMSDLFPNRDHSDVWMKVAMPFMILSGLGILDLVIETHGSVLKLISILGSSEDPATLTAHKRKRDA